MHNYEGDGDKCGHCGCMYWNPVHFPAGEKDYRLLQVEALESQLTAATQEVERLKQRDQRWQEEAFTSLTHCEAVGADKAASVMRILLSRMGIEEPNHA